MVGMGEIEVWRIAVTPANSAAAASLAPRVLDAAEQRKAAAFRRPADQDLYRIAHVALRTLLADRLHRPAAELRFRQAACPGCGKPHGRPEVISDEPLEFSLSHTTGLALIALAPDTVGLDVERLAAFGAATATDIAGQLHPAEQAELAAVAADLRPAATLRCWVRKEAYLKGTGMGLGAAPPPTTWASAPATPPTPRPRRPAGPSSPSRSPTPTTPRSRCAPTPLPRCPSPSATSTSTSTPALTPALTWGSAPGSAEKAGQRTRDPAGGDGSRPRVRHSKICALVCPSPSSRRFREEPLGSPVRGYRRQ